MSVVLLSETEIFYFVFCTMTKKCTINAQIITLSYLLAPITAVSLDGRQMQSVPPHCASLTRIGRNAIQEHVNAVCTEWATKKQPGFRFARVLATVLISVFMLWTRATFSWLTLYKANSCYACWLIRDFSVRCEDIRLEDEQNICF